MRRALTLGFAGMMLFAPALRGQERARTLSPPEVRTAIPRGLLDGEGMSKAGRIVSFTLIGGLIGGTIAYYTGPQTIPGCVGCPLDRKPRIIKGALIGGSIGLTLGAIVTFGGGKPRLELKR
jgi:hypothetical protein